MEPFYNSKTVLEAVLYLGLLLGGLVFVSKDIEDYLSGSTNYSVTSEPLSLKDLPTLTVCLGRRPIYLYDQNGNLLTQYDKIVYGQNFSIDIRISSQAGSNTTLQENKYVEVISGLQVHLSELFLSKKR